jgi:ABC-type nitrate/sulfonate/bicarbonate transport system substrate-binding protein
MPDPRTRDLAQAAANAGAACRAPTNRRDAFDRDGIVRQLTTARRTATGHPIEMRVTLSVHNVIRAAEEQRVKDLKPYALNILFRANHNAMWEIAEKAGILGEMNLSIASMEYADNSKEAEAKLFAGGLDFIAGNHISPYMWVAKNRPIVQIASPGNAVRDAIVSKRPIESLEELAGQDVRVADSDLHDRYGSIQHPRGNHILETIHAGLQPEQTHWVACGEFDDPKLQANVVEAVASGKADIGFFRHADADAAQAAGLHPLRLPTFPMINGATITTTYDLLHQKEQLAERLVRAMVLAIHYARVHPEDAQELLDTKMGKPYTEHGGRAQGIARYPMKPYPTQAAIDSAFELCCMQYEETKEIQPAALWDLHYLRELELSGFIDELIQEQPAAAPQR